MVTAAFVDAPLGLSYYDDAYHIRENVFRELRPPPPPDDY